MIHYIFVIFSSRKKIAIKFFFSFKGIIIIRSVFMYKLMRLKYMAFFMVFYNSKTTILYYILTFRD